MTCACCDTTPSAQFTVETTIVNLDAVAEPPRWVFLTYITVGNHKVQLSESTKSYEDPDECLREGGIHLVESLKAAIVNALTP